MTESSQQSNSRLLAGVVEQPTESTTEHKQTENKEEGKESTTEFMVGAEAIKILQSIEENTNPDEIDKQFHYSNNFIDAMYDTLENIQNRRDEIADYNAENPRKKQRQYQLHKSDITYPEHNKKHKETKAINFKRWVEKGMFRINTEHELLLYLKIQKRNKVTKTTALIVPRQEQLRGVWKACHKHKGINVSERNLCAHWKVKSTRNWVEARAIACKCHESKKKKPKSVVVGKAPLKIPTLPCAVMETVHWDLSGKYPESNSGNKYVLHMVDAYSSYCVVVAIPSKKREFIAASFLRYWVSYWGWPSNLYNDNGGEFKNELTDALAELAQYRKFSIVPRRPQANGYAESNVKNFKTWLKKMYRMEGKLGFDIDVLADLPKDWDGYLARYQVEKNKTYLGRIGTNPYDVVVNRNNNIRYEIENFKGLLKKIMEGRMQSKKGKNEKEESEPMDEFRNMSLTPRLRESVKNIQELLYQPDAEEQKMRAQFHYGTSNSFNQGANDLASNSMKYVYQNRMLQHESITATNYGFKRVKKAQYDKGVRSFASNSRVQVQKNGKWRPKLC